MAEDPLLALRAVRAGYGQGEVLQGVSLEVPAGSFTALLGANGAGKSTTLRTVSGLLRASDGEIRFAGRRIDGLHASRVMRLGLALVPEGRRVFAAMSVLENLEMGGFTLLMPGRRAEFARSLEFVLEMFPRLRERAGQPAGTLSGGEQQMLAIGRALMSGPRLLLLDEPSMGLAPRIVTQIFEALQTLRNTGTTILVSEQNSAAALRWADRAAVLESGRIALAGAARTLQDDPRVREAYLGT